MYKHLVFLCLVLQNSIISVVHLQINFLNLHLLKTANGVLDLELIVHRSKLYYCIRGYLRNLQNREHCQVAKIITYTALVNTNFVFFES